MCRRKSMITSVCRLLDAAFSKFHKKMKRIIMDFYCGLHPVNKQKI